MPEIEAAERGMPRSSLRYRPIDEASRQSVVTAATTPVAQRASRIRPQPADDDLISEWTRVDIEEEPFSTSPEPETLVEARPVRPARALRAPALAQKLVSAERPASKPPVSERPAGAQKLATAE